MAIQVQLQAFIDQAGAGTGTPFNASSLNVPVMAATSVVTGGFIASGGALANPSQPATAAIINTGTAIAFVSLGITVLANFTANKDNCVDLSTSGVYTVTAVNLGSGAAHTPAAGSIFLYYATTGAATVSSVTPMAALMPVIQDMIAAETAEAATNDSLALTTAIGSAPTLKNQLNIIRYVIATALGLTWTNSRANTKKAVLQDGTNSANATWNGTLAVTGTITANNGVNLASNGLTNVGSISGTSLLFTSQPILFMLSGASSGIVIGTGSPGWNNSQALAVYVTPLATPSYGQISLGAGPFDGSTAGHFVGINSNGSYVAINGGAATTVNFLDFQVASVQKFSVDSTGSVIAKGTGHVFGGTISIQGAVSITAGGLALTNTPINLVSSITTGTTITTGIGQIYVSNAPTATAQYGSVNIGSGSFDGVSAGHYVGSGTGTSFVINEASGYSSDYVNIGKNGTFAFKIANSGQLSLTGAATSVAPSAGGAGALPATPAGYYTVVINGVSRQLAYY